MSKSQRSKGQRAEREVAQAFVAAGYPARRGYQARDGRDMPDVVLTGRAAPPLWIECKHYRARAPILAALEQAIAATDGRIPIAVTRTDREPWTCTLRLEDLLAIVQRAYPPPSPGPAVAPEERLGVAGEPEPTPVVRGRMPGASNSPPPAEYETDLDAW